MSIADTAKSQDHRTQADAGYSLIKQAILTCELEPSSHVTEAQFVERFALGRASVRSALKRLYQEGLVDVVPRHGYTIAPLGLTGLQQLFELEIILEPNAARLAAGRVDPDTLRELDARCAESAGTESPEESRRWIAANRDVHVEIARSTGNAMLEEFVRILYDRLERFLNNSLLRDKITKKVHHSHDDLVAALISGDGDLAARVAEQQLRHNQRVILEPLLSAR